MATIKSIEQKARAYDEAIKRGLDYIRQTPATEMVTRQSILEHIFPELKESEDEKMIQYFKGLAPFDKADELYEKYGFSHKDAIAWLEKQGGHAKFINGIQVGDKVTRNEDGVLVNLSQLNRVAKKQGEQKYIPKYKIGDYVKNTNYKGEPIYEIVYMDKECYICEYRGKEKMGDKAVMHFSFDNPYLRLAEQKPAWSEGDEKMFEHIIAKATLHFSSINYLDEEEINFLKALRPQKQWKPSEEQMNLLREVQQALLGRDCHNRFVNFMYELKRLREK